MDPLARLSAARDAGRIPDGTYRLICKRFPLALSGIDRIERSSTVHFPPAYVEPAVTVTAQGRGSYEYGILFARTIPLVHGGFFRPVIQISAPLVAYGLKGTIHAILAHEFLHYLELVRRVSTMDITSEEMSENLFASAYLDGGRLFEAGSVFDDRTLLRHITKRFPAGFHDGRLESKTVKMWIEAGLPKNTISLRHNAARIPIQEISSARQDPQLVKKVSEMASRKKARRNIY